MKKFKGKTDIIPVTPKVGVVYYDCSDDAIPLIFNNGNLEEAKKNNPGRYHVPLYPLSSILFLKLGEAIDKIQTEKLSEENWILTITPDRIGFHCYDSRTKEE